MAQLWGQADFRRLADRLGYDFADCVIFDPKFGRPSSARLEAPATRLDAEAVKVPNVAHVEGGEIPSALMRQLDVITVNPEEMYAKRATSPLRDFSPIKADGARLRDHLDAREPQGRR